MPKPDPSDPVNQLGAAESHVIARWCRIMACPPFNSPDHATAAAILVFASVLFRVSADICSAIDRAADHVAQIDRTE